MHKRCAWCGTEFELQAIRYFTERGEPVAWLAGDRAIWWCSVWCQERHADWCSGKLERFESGELRT